MSKSSNEDQRISTLAEHYAQALVDATVRLEEISKSLLNNSYVNQGASSSIAEYNKGKITADKTIKLLEKIEKQMENSLKADYGIEGAGSGKSRAAINIFIETIAKRLGTSKIDKVLEEKLIAAFKNFHSSLIIESMKAEERNDKKGIYYKNTIGNEKLGKVYKEFGEKIGLKLDDFKYSVTSLFQWAQAGTKKALIGLGKDLIEGLEKSKWVGGALQDTFRLIGLLGANWLTKFGQLGRILGGAFYVAMTTAGPLLVNMLLKGMGKLFTSLPRMLSGLWGSAVKLSTNVRGPLSVFTPGRWGMMSGAGKAASVGRLAGAGLAAGALGTGAFFAGRESYRSFKQGDKVGGSAFGIGAAGLGVAAIAALVAGIAAPVTLIAAAIGGIAVGVGALWKNREKILEHYKKHKEFYNKLMAVMELIMPPLFILRKSIEWIIDHWPFGKKDKDGNENSPWQSFLNMIGLGQDKKAVEHIAGVGVNKAGALLGIEKLDKMEASRVTEAYFNKYGDRAIYEKVGSKHASLIDFENDLAIRDKSGKATAAVLYKGASENLEKMWDALVAQGMSRERAELLKYSSGRSTLTSPHQKGGTHENIMNMVTDLAAANWTDSEWEAAMEVLKPMLDEQGFQLVWEGKDASGKTTFSKDFVRGLSSNKHFHVQLKPGYENMGPEVANENIANYKTLKENYSMEVKNLAAFVDPKEIEKIKKDRAQSMLEKGYSVDLDKMELTEADYLEVLKKNKIYKDENTGSWMRNRDNGNVEALWRNNSTGNLEWRLIVQTMQNASQYSTNGRS